VLAQRSVAYAVWSGLGAVFVTEERQLCCYVGLAEELYNPYLTRVYNGFSPNMCKAVRLM